MSFYPFTLLLCILILFTCSKAQTALGRNCTSSDHCGGGLVCKIEVGHATQTCSYCNATAECKDIFYLYDCKRILDHPPICQRKDLLPLVSPIDGVIVVMAWLSGSLASISGIGGSAILVPMLQIVGQFPLSVAITISKATVFGMSLTNMFILVRKTHPGTDIPVINYSISLIFVPSVLLGISLGVLLILVLPEVALLLSLMLILPPTGIRTLIQAVSMFQRENTEGHKQEEESRYSMLTEEDKQSHDHREQYMQIGIISIAWVTLLVVTLLKGGHGTGSLVGIKTCSDWYWILYSMNFPIIGALITACCIYLYVQDRIRSSKEGYIRKFYEFQWTVKRTILLPIWSFISGILSTALGAALIRNSVLTEMGVDVEVAAATCSFVNLWDSSLSTILFIIHGTLPWDYGAIFFAIGLLAGFCGQFILDFIVRKLNRKSIISFVLGFLILIASLIMVALGIYNLVEQIRRGGNIGFKSPCNIHN